MPPATTKSQLLYAARKADEIRNRIMLPGTVIRSRGERDQIAQCLETLADGCRRALDGPLANLPEG